MHILAVDDEIGALQLLKSAIQQVITPNDTVSDFLSAQEALAAAKTQKFDVVFCDIRMPEMLGTDFAKRLKTINPQINIVFVTGYSEYAGDAFSIHASGYITKPVMPEDIVSELKNLRFPASPQRKEAIYAVTFGNFDLLVHGEPVHFSRAKSKELLAYLIDRRGSTVGRREMASVLFEAGDFSRSEQSYLSKILKDLISDLQAVGAEKILGKRLSEYYVICDMLRCDSYDYLDGAFFAINAFHGEYMEQYSWAEFSKGKFCAF